LIKLFRYLYYAKMENRIGQFEFEGEKFVYYDLSHLRNNTRFREFIASAKEAIRRYPGDNSLFSITNVEGVLYDSETRALQKCGQLYCPPIPPPARYNGKLCRFG
jgi:hypothetical protein